MALNYTQQITTALSSVTSNYLSPMTLSSTEMNVATMSALIGMNGTSNVLSLPSTESLIANPNTTTSIDNATVTSIFSSTPALSTLLMNITSSLKMPTSYMLRYYNGSYKIHHHPSIPFSAYHNRNYYNDTFYDYNTCPSIQMPVGNLISMFLYAIVCVVGLFGNTLVIFVVLRYQKMYTVTNIYILNLAIADQCFLIGIPFLIMTMYLGEWTFGKAMCKAYMVSTSITQFTSSIFLLIMSADRYMAVCHPISSARYRTIFVSKVVTAVAWPMSALIMLPVMIYANTIEKEIANSHKISCIIQWPEEHEARSGTTFTLYSLILGFAIPLTLILACYYFVIRKLKTVGPKKKSKDKLKVNRKVTRLVLTVITVYILCWLPYWISQVALINSPPYICKSRLEITIFVLIGCLGYSNSAMNPILYAFLSENFKKGFISACKCAGKDFNAQLTLENSIFHRFGKRNSNADKNFSTAAAAILQRSGTGGADCYSGTGGGYAFDYDCGKLSEYNNKQHNQQKIQSVIVIDPATAAASVTSSTGTGSSIRKVPSTVSLLQPMRSSNVSDCSLSGTCSTKTFTTTNTLPTSTSANNDQRPPILQTDL